MDQCPTSSVEIRVVGEVNSGRSFSGKRIIEFVSGAKRTGTGVTGKTRRNLGIDSVYLMLHGYLGRTSILLGSRVQPPSK